MAMDFDIFASSAFKLKHTAIVPTFDISTLASKPQTTKTVLMEMEHSPRTCEHACKVPPAQNISDPTSALSYLTSVYPESQHTHHPCHDEPVPEVDDPSIPLTASSSRNLSSSSDAKSERKKSDSKSRTLSPWATPPHPPRSTSAQAYYGSSKKKSGSNTIRNGSNTAAASTVPKRRCASARAKGTLGYGAVEYGYGGFKKNSFPGPISHMPNESSHPPKSPTLFTRVLSLNPPNRQPSSRAVTKPTSFLSPTGSMFRLRIQSAKDQSTGMSASQAIRQSPDGIHGRPELGPDGQTSLHKQNQSHAADVAELSRPQTARPSYSQASLASSQPIPRSQSSRPHLSRSEPASPVPGPGPSQGPLKQSGSFAPATGKKPRCFSAGGAYRGTIRQQTFDWDAAVKDFKQENIDRYYSKDRFVLSSDVKNMHQEKRAQSARMASVPRSDFSQRQKEAERGVYRGKYNRYNKVKFDVAKDNPEFTYATPYEQLRLLQRSETSVAILASHPYTIQNYKTKT